MKVFSGLSRALSLALVIAALGAATGQGQELPVVQPSQDVSSESVDQAQAQNLELWFVELSSAPMADGTSASTLKKEKQEFRNAAKRAGLRYTERYAFDTLWNGFSIKIDPTQLGTLARLPGVKALYPVETISLPTENLKVSQTLATAITMTGADVAQNDYGFTGAGVKVAIIDSGVDYNHPDLGGSGVNNPLAFPTTRVVAGFDFVGDAYNASELNPIINPDAYPDDCGGHGTHVAGIVGANGAVKGVAPNVLLGAYKVFGCTGQSAIDILIAAMERALADGMRVVNMSVTTTFQWPQYPTAQAADRLVNKGVVVVSGIGNDAQRGLYAAGAPGVGEKVIGVASFDNVSTSPMIFTISPGDTKIGYLPLIGAPAPPVAGSFPMERTGTPASLSDACAPLPAGSLAGKMALIRRGTCTLYSKARNAELAGAVGVVFYNNSAGRFPTSSVTPTNGGPAVTIPVVGVSDVEGLLIDAQIVAGATSMTWTPDRFDAIISAFSSYGLAADLSLKPDLGAPGGTITSTYPVELGLYAIASGTSQASPHVAGAAALLLEARPHTPSQAVRSIFQNTAEPKRWSFMPGAGGFENVHRQGAGLIQIDNAILSTTKITPGKLSLGESEMGPVTRTLRIANEESWAVTYDLSHDVALATSPNTFLPTALDAPSMVSFSSPLDDSPVTSITVPAGGVATVNVTVAPNAALADRSLYGGYVLFAPQGGDQTYRVPFAGFKGDYQSTQVLVPTMNGFPWIARQVGPSFLKIPTTGWTFTLVGTDVPYVIVHFDHQSRRVRMEVFDAVTGRSWHRALEFEYFTRNNQSFSFFSFPFDGTTTAGKKTYVVPDGQYVIKLSVLKAEGDDANPDHWETWTSPVFTIARP